MVRARVTRRRLVGALAVILVIAACYAWSKRQEFVAKAIESGSSRRLRLGLLVTSPDDQGVDAKGYTRSFLELAISLCDVGQVRLLLDAGANPNLGGMTDALAYCDNNLEVARVLLQAHANTSVTTFAEIESVNALKLLLEYGASPCSSGYGWWRILAIEDALPLAMDHCKLKGVLPDLNAILRHFPYGSERHPSGKVQLASAAYLLSMGADPNAPDETTGATVLDMAYESHDTTLIEFLRTHGAHGALYAGTAQADIVAQRAEQTAKLRRLSNVPQGPGCALDVVGIDGTVGVSDSGWAIPLGDTVKVTGNCGQGFMHYAIFGSGSSASQELNIPSLGGRMAKTMTFNQRCILCDMKWYFSPTAVSDLSQALLAREAFLVASVKLSVAPRAGRKQQSR